MADAAGTLSYTKPTSITCLKSTSPLPFNLAYFIEEPQNAHRQLLSRPCMFCKYFSTHNGALVSSWNAGPFASNSVFQFLQRMWTAHIFHHSVSPTHNIAQIQISRSRSPQSVKDLFHGSHSEVCCVVWALSSSSSSSLLLVFFFIDKWYPN